MEMDYIAERYMCLYLKLNTQGDSEKRLDKWGTVQNKSKNLMGGLNYLSFQMSWFQKFMTRSWLSLKKRKSRNGKLVPEWDDF